MSRKAKKYQSFPHPSDIGLTVYGGSLQQLFENAAFALFDTLCNLDAVSEVESVDIDVHGDDRESLLVNFLNELLYLQSVNGWLFRRIEIPLFREHSLNATAWGELYKMETHELFHEIKCATYHNLQIRKKWGKWRVDIVFDV